MKTQESGGGQHDAKREVSQLNVSRTQSVHYITPE